MDRTEDEVSGSKLGAVDYITKPFQPEEVLARVDTHLTMHQTKYTARPGVVMSLEEVSGIDARNIADSSSCGTSMCLQVITPWLMTTRHWYSGVLG